MKILLLSDTYSEHTEKWALGLAGQGISVGLFSFNKASYEWYNHPNITVFFEPDEKINAESTLTKLSYLKYVNVLRKIIRHYQPDILHAHYATSYGLVGALSGFSPFFLSVWGSDVYDFPARSKLHKRVFQYNLRKADVIMSTSRIMREEVKKYTSREVVVTPFGVDTTDFSPREVPGRDPSVIHIGTIKPIEKKYGIEYIIWAASLLAKNPALPPMQFHLVGPGSDLEYYRKMISEKGLEQMFTVTGRVPFSEISRYHNMLDIFLNVSIDDSESFGVATVEAMACEKPVIVTDVGGLMEVVDNGRVGLVVKKEDAEAIAGAIEKLIMDKKLRSDLGRMGRQHVLANYDWNQNLQHMIEQYRSFVNAQDKTKKKK